LSPEWLTAWRACHSDYQIVVPHAELLLAVRGRVLDQGDRPLGEFSHAGWLDAEIAGRTVRAVVVDIASNPMISRREPLSELGEWLHCHNKVPQVVMGDFNTPDESVWFAPFRPEFRETFRTAGRGYAPTWPWPAPVLKLDHIWVNRQVDVRRAWQTSTWHSDHRPQWAELAPATSR
ncbi:MAG TPA: endonuclease/exonuclease/phosphatase family protein, partial [Planctomycetaceae bacterium]|nr:endonuclease/exonuclease/phosphatase family protein [Planctomycetaceae bacterium]